MLSFLCFLGFKDLSLSVASSTITVLACVPAKCGVSLIFSALQTLPNADLFQYSSNLNLSFVVIYSITWAFVSFLLVILCWRVILTYVEWLYSSINEYLKHDASWPIAMETQLMQLLIWRLTTRNVVEIVDPKTA